MGKHLPLSYDLSGVHVPRTEIDNVRRFPAKARESFRSDFRSGS
jgi:hypothetical protein